MQESWRPTASLDNLKFRAKIIAQIREFFSDRNILEVETPLLSHATVTDAHIASFHTEFSPTPNSQQNLKLYLQTSPEFAMKRLLAHGMGSIYQICKAFRNGEVSRKHNPEFTILEWYRINFSLSDLMTEVDEFLQYILKTSPAARISYQELFQQNLGFNPHTVTTTTLQKIAQQHGLALQTEDEEQNKDTWLDLLLTHIIEPQLGQDLPLFIYDYPATQAALAKIRKENNFEVGERFEVYYKGLELANGYHELADAQEQLSRFEKDNSVRQKLNLPTIPVDLHLLKALPTFPSCSGVALGVDRVILLALEKFDIAEVISFTLSNA